MPPFKRNKASSPGPCDGLGTRCTPFGKEFPVALGTIGLLIFGSKFLARQDHVTIGTSETFPVPRFILERDTPGGHDFLAFRTFRSEFVLKAIDAIHVSLVGNDERLGTHSHFTHYTLKACLVPLAVLVIHSFCTGLERFSTGFAPRSEFRVITRPTKDVGVLHSEGFARERTLTLLTGEAILPRETNGSK